jgi:hypothetical protein
VAARSVFAKPPEGTTLTTHELDFPLATGRLPLDRSSGTMHVHGRQMNSIEAGSALYFMAVGAR